MQNVTPLDLHGATHITLFGGVYNNWLSLQATLALARRSDATFCLGDMGGFGPLPDRAIEILRTRPDLHVMQGNYDHSIGHRLDDCACGYTDPRDNHFAQISYDYTAAHTSPDHKDWLRDLPQGFRFSLGKTKVLCAHGSPRKVNEFLWSSTCPDPFLEWLLTEHDADLICVTHTGVPWVRRLPSGRQVVNVGAIGRPANQGHTHVDCATLTFDRVKDQVQVELVPVTYDHHTLAEIMAKESLPQEFIQTVLTGYWTTCLEVLPAKERALGIY